MSTLIRIRICKHLILNKKKKEVKSNLFVYTWFGKIAIDGDFIPVKTLAKTFQAI